MQLYLFVSGQPRDLANTKLSNLTARPIEGLTKVPPQNIEAEIAVLGSMLIDEEAVARVIELLDEGCFYKDTHKKIFSTDF